MTSLVAFGLLLGFVFGAKWRLQAKNMRERQFTKSSSHRSQAISVLLQYIMIWSSCCKKSPPNLSFYKISKNNVSIGKDFSVFEMWSAFYRSEIFFLKRLWFWIRFARDWLKNLVSITSNWQKNSTLAMKHDISSQTLILYICQTTKLFIFRSVFSKFIMWVFWKCFI